jgi:hypothetical protein
MERLKKSVYCNKLNKNVKATFYIHEVKQVNGDFKRKAVDFYKCEDKNKCGDELAIDCSCLKELNKVEWELNS